MLRICVCCGGGMSSSVLAARFEEKIIEKGWSDKVSVDYLPITFMFEQQDRFDIALLCPHLRYGAQRAVETGKITIPLYLIPSRLYGTMELVPLLEDAIDVFKIFKETKENPVHFPEEGLLVTKRDTSHRRWIKRHPIEE